MRHLLVKVLRIGAWLGDSGVEDAAALKQPTTTNDPSKPHRLSEQEIDLLAELLAISAAYSETRDISSALADFYPGEQIAGSS